jgi:hypothetical protein
MAFGFADWGIRCGQCGRFLNMFAQAIPQLPDPFPVTCPYCGHSARYPKSAICSDIAFLPSIPSAARWGPVVLAGLAIILVLVLIATRARSAEDDRAPAHASADDCAVIAAVGKAKLGWGAHAPGYLLNRNSFGQDCNWARLGIVGPSVAPASDSPFYQGLRTSFSRVSYRPDGVASVEYGVSGNASQSSYFSAGYICTAARKAGRWTLIECWMRYVT